VSQYSASQLEHFRIAPASKITVIPNGHEHIDRWQATHSLGTRQAAGPATIVLIGSPAPHKNIALMLRLADRLRQRNIKLAIAGALDTKVFKLNEYETANSTSLKSVVGGVIWLGRVSDKELAALLKDSLCLVFPSYAEGFGLPALEAMALGCPVIASDRASIPEVCGSAALYASPDDDWGWLENIIRLRTDARLRRELVEKGIARAKIFSWRQSAQLYIRLMAQLDGTQLYDETRSQMTVPAD
jgi:glycosyltransferase involved in cell wall biosynthesis